MWVRTTGVAANILPQCDWQQIPFTVVYIWRKIYWGIIVHGFVIHPFATVYPWTEAHYAFLVIEGEVSYVYFARTFQFDWYWPQHVSIIGHKDICALHESSWTIICTAIDEKQKWCLCTCKVRKLMVGNPRLIMLRWYALVTRGWTDNEIIIEIHYSCVI